MVDQVNAQDVLLMFALSQIFFLGGGGRVGGPETYFGSFVVC